MSKGSGQARARSGRWWQDTWHTFLEQQQLVRGTTRQPPQRVAEDGVVLERAHADAERARGVLTDGAEGSVALGRKGGGADGVLGRIHAEARRDQPTPRSQAP